MPWNRVEIVDPSLLRAKEYLPPGHQFISLAQRSKSHIVGPWLIINRCCIAPSHNEDRNLADGRSRYRQSFDILSVCRTGARTYWDERYYGSQLCTAHCLAICAVANGRRFWIRFGLKRHVSSVTASISFHDYLLEFSNRDGRPLVLAPLAATPPQRHRAARSTCGASSFDHLVGAGKQRRRTLRPRAFAVMRLMTSFIVGDFAQSIDSRK
jgi:hypothetical protein